MPAGCEVSGAPAASPPEVSLKGSGITRGVCHLFDAHCGVCHGFFWAAESCSETKLVFSINMMLVSKGYDTTPGTNIQPGKTLKFASALREGFILVFLYP